MQELRLVAVSEDGTYLVLATAGRGTRFTLPVDDRLRAAVRGHFSRLGQFEIEVESPLRPKEIQARIRAGETAEEIAESAGIPVERVRWFEGPVLQEREYMAQQAQRVPVRRPGESTPGPPLGETVEERLGRGGVDLEEAEWDAWKCEDGTWRVRLSFFDNGRPHAAEWVFEPRRRHVSPLDEVAARLTAIEWDDDALGDTVTPLVPRRPSMKVVSDTRDLAVPPARGIGFEPEAGGERPSDLRQEPPLRAAEPRREYIVERGRFAEPRPLPAAQDREPPLASRPAARPVQETSQEPQEEPALEAEEFAGGEGEDRTADVSAPADAAENAADDAAEPTTEEAAQDTAEDAEQPEAAPREEAAEETEARDTAGTGTAASQEDAPEPEAGEAAAEAPETSAGPEDEVAGEDSPTEGAAEDEPQAEAEPETEAEAEPETAPADEARQDGPAEDASAEAPEEPAREPAGEPAAKEEAPDEAGAAPSGRKAAEEAPPQVNEDPAGREAAQPAPKPQRPPHREAARAPAKKKPAARPSMPPAPVDKPVGSPAAAAGDAPAGPQRPARNRRKAKGKRASVPSWDEIMFGARRPD
ncbi:septation protein SepH [Actinomadura viridis]|uniref:septation protein SepH n=1 Tax=Actinomadura viridis TaxID=58110 RepID=UPI0036B12D26